MNILHQRIYRRIFSQWKTYISLFLMLVLMISVTSGFLVVADSMKILSLDLLHQGKVEDGQIITAFPLSDAIKKDFGQFHIQWEEAFQVDAKIHTDKTLRIYKNREHINLPVLNAGRLANKKNEIAINHRYASANHLHLGDEIILPGKYVQSKKDTPLKIVGFFAVPDYHACFSNNSDFMFNTINFGVGLVSEDFFSEIDSSMLRYQLSYRFKDRTLEEKEMDSLNEDILKTANQDKTVIDHLVNKDNNGINYVLNDMGGDRPMMIVLMSILILMIAFIFGVSIVKTVSEEAQIIGVLLANGYGKKDLLWNYLASPVIVTFLAALVGNLLGYTAYIPVYRSMYYSSFDFPNFQSQFNMEALFITTLLPIFIILCFNFFYILRKLRFSPLQFLKKDLHKDKKPTRFSLMPKNFLHRYRIRVFLAHRGDFIMIILGTFLTGILLLYGLSAKPTFDQYGDSLTENMVSKYQYVLKAPVPLKKDSPQAEKYTIIPASIYHPLRKADEQIQWIGIKENSKYYPDLTLPEKENEIVISRNLAKKFRLKEGDTITVNISILDKEKTFTILHIYDFNAYFAIFTKQSYANQFLEEDKDYFNGYYSNENLSIDKNYLASTIDKSSITDIAEQLSTILGPMINVFIFVSLIFFVVFLYNLTKMISNKNQTSIAYLKILGYTTKEINKIYLRSITITLLITLIFGIPLQVYILKKVAYYALLKFSGYIEFIIPTKNICFAVLLTLITYLFVALMERYHVSKMHFQEVLKNRE